jgi:dTDP-4-dehydrorhamnose 3,5-epimerase
MPFEFQTTEITGLVIVKSRSFPDERGEFAEVYKYSEFAANGIPDQFVQTNYSKSKKGVLRGMHYQLPPYAQAKLVRVTYGSVFDVAVDIRKDSPTYGRWLGVTLSAVEKNMLYIPEGFAHGFCSLEDDTQMVYNCSREYSPEHERGMVWNDPNVGIEWLITDPILAERDANYPSFDSIEI